MNDTILCPSCGKPIPLTQAISHQIDEKYRKEMEAERQKSEAEKLKLIEQAKRRIEEEKEKALKGAEADIRIKITKEMELKIKDSDNERKELNEQNKLLQEQLLELNKTMRQLRNESREKELELTKRFNEEQEKLRLQEQHRLEEQYKFQLLEKDKKLLDALKANEDLQRKLTQGSQQMQGEVLELAVEEMLQHEFPYDRIEPVPKGVTGADLIQTVCNAVGKPCGQIIWELKRTKSWSNAWVPKLKDDQRKVKAEIAILISDMLPDTINHFGQIEGVWVCKFEYIVGIAYALRNQLLETASLKAASDGKAGKMEVLYNYITSIEFRHRVEAILEAFTGMQEEIEREKRWYAQKWSREEKHLRKVLDTTLGMHGELQSITGKTIPELEQMNELPGEEVEQELF